MKILDKFTELDKALAYIIQINEAYQTQAAEKLDSEQKLRLLQESLDKETTKVSTHLETISKLEANEIVLQNSLAKNELELSSAISEVSELGRKLDLQEKFGKDGKIVIVDGVSYSLAGDTFLYGGGVKTAEELSKDTIQLQKMVNSGSGCLIPIE